MLKRYDEALAEARLVEKLSPHDPQTINLMGFVFGAQKREIVLGATFALDLAGIAIKHARLADEVEREIRIGEFFLELGVCRDQLDHALAEN